MSRRPETLGALKRTGYRPETVRHEMLCQYTPQSSYWMPNPAKAFGGFNGGLIDPDIRNDFVQHNMSAVLGTERHMAYRARKEELTGGPVWTRLNLDEERVHPGVPPEEMDRLREATQRYRGDTIWETRWKEQRSKEAATPAEGATLPE